MVLIWPNVNTITFSAKTQYLSCVLKYIAQTVINVLLLSPENTKKAISDNLKNTNMGVNMITRQISTCFSSIL